MIDFDLSDIPYLGKLSEEDQKEFERRAKIMDDPNAPPIILDEEGNIIKDEQVEDKSKESV